MTNGARELQDAIDRKNRKDGTSGCGKRPGTRDNPDTTHMCVPGPHSAHINRTPRAGGNRAAGAQKGPALKSGGSGRCVIYTESDCDIHLAPCRSRSGQSRRPREFLMCAVGEHRLETADADKRRRSGYPVTSVFSARRMRWRSWSRRSRRSGERGRRRAGRSSVRRSDRERSLRRGCRALRRGRRRAAT